MDEETLIPESHLRFRLKLTLLKMRLEFSVFNNSLVFTDSFAQSLGTVLMRSFGVNCISLPLFKAMQL